MQGFWGIILAIFFTFLQAFLVAKNLATKSLPYAFFSLPEKLANSSKSMRYRASFAPELFTLITTIFFALALCDFHYSTPYLKKKEHTLSLPKAYFEGNAIYLALDVSGSMSEKVMATDKEGRSYMQKKIDILKQIALSFVDQQEQEQGRSDMIGVITLARSSEVLVPLTLDHEAVEEAIKSLYARTNKNEEGTVLGYAIFKAANLIASMRQYSQKMVAQNQQPYVLHDAVVVLITDGFQDPNHQDRDKELRNIPPLQAAEYAANEHIRLYVINVDPALASEKYGPERRQVEKAAAETGGKFFLLQENDNIQKIYREIDALEKSHWQIESSEQQLIAKKSQKTLRGEPLYPYFLGLGLLFFALFIFSETYFLRRWP